MDLASRALFHSLNRFGTDKNKVQGFPLDVQLILAGRKILKKSIKKKHIKNQQMNSSINKKKIITKTNEFES